MSFGTPSLGGSCVVCSLGHMEAIFSTYGWQVSRLEG